MRFPSSLRDSHRLARRRRERPRARLGRLGALFAYVLATLVVACNLLAVKPTRWARSDDGCPPGNEVEDWKTAAPADAGFDPAALEDLAARVTRGDLGNVHAVVVVRNGRIVFERYFTGRDSTWSESLGDVTFDAATLHDLRSVTKSVVGALVGIAVGDGLLPGLDAPLPELLPAYRGRLPSDVGRIQLRHALSMSAGLAWDELSMPYWWPWNDETEMWRNDDPVGFVLTRAVVAEPGAAFAYNGGLPTVLGAIVEQASGKTLDRFAAERLFCPLGVTSFEWMRHPSGTFVAASGLRLRPRDMARFGWMMLEGGRLGGRQIVPEAYARASLARQETTQSFIAPGYGYQWWIQEAELGGTRREIPSAIGNGGQRIAVVPEQRIVVVVTGGMYNDRAGLAMSESVVAAVLAAMR